VTTSSPEPNRDNRPAEIGGFFILGVLPPAKINSGLFAVAVATQNITLGYFSENSFPRVAVLDHFRDGCFLLSTVTMMKLQSDWVRFGATNTGVLAQILVFEFIVAFALNNSIAFGFCNIFCPVVTVVVGSVGGMA
jgi:hypothetical protein